MSMENYVSGPMMARIDKVRGFIWDAALRFLDDAQLPKDILYMTYYWSAYCFSISQILTDHKILDEVKSNFVAYILFTFGIHQNDEHAVSLITEFQNDSLHSIEELELDFSSPFGLYPLFELGKTICSESDTDMADPEPSYSILYLSHLVPLTESVTALLAEPLPRPCLRSTEPLIYNPPKQRVVSKSSQKSMDKLLAASSGEFNSDPFGDDPSMFFGKMLGIVLILMLIILFLFSPSSSDRNADSYTKSQDSTYDFSYLATYETYAPSPAYVPMTVEPLDPELLESLKNAENTNIQFISYSEKVWRSGTGRVNIKGLPNTEYSISVFYSSGESEAFGLVPKYSDSNGNVSWSWVIGSNTYSGTYEIIVTGGGSSASVYFEVA